MIQEACSKKKEEPTWYFGIITTKKNFRILNASYLHFRSDSIGRVRYFYYIYVGSSIFVFLLELYEIKFSYTVLRGGVPRFTYLNKVYDWFEERLDIQAIVVYIFAYKERMYK